MPRVPYLLFALAAAVILPACADAVRTPVESSPLANVTTATAPSLVINEVMSDPSAVTDDMGEWIELHNPGTAAVDLRGWRLGSNNDAGIAISTTVSIAAGGYVVLARNGTTSKNGGVTAAVAYGTALTLANTSDAVTLRNPSGATVDSVAWGSALTAGATRGVTDPGAVNTDVKGTNWHTATSVFGKGDRGTPGARNDGYVAPLSPASSVVVTPASASVGVAGSQTFSASARDANGAVVSTSFTWSSSNPA
ncbi:MAG TPA: lamin tail domain-containing protein, partial [Longimicrobium sp.]|nr:lamin tail domain-containing protein [Longimicrobium sp.]